MSKLSAVVAQDIAQDIGSRFGFDEVLIIGRKHADEENVVIVSWGRTEKYRDWADQLAHYFRHKLQQWHIAGMDHTLDRAGRQVSLSDNDKIISTRVPAPPRGAAS